MQRPRPESKLFRLLAALSIAAAAACTSDAGEPGDADTAPTDATVQRDAPVDDAAAEDGDGDDPIADADAEDGVPAPPTPDERFGPPPAFASGEQTVDDLFEGVRIISRQTTEPRPLRYYVVQLDADAEGLSYRVTPPNGDDPRETTRETVRTWVTQAGAQLGINLHFFRPWPPEDAYADCLGLAASDGDVFSPFEPSWPLAIALGPDNRAAFVRRDEADPSGLSTVPAVDIDDAFGGNEQIVTDGAITGTWEELHPRTAAGVTADGDLVLIVVDGRQEGVSEGMTTPEVADVLLAFGVVDALNLDGGGSTTLVVADPEPRLFNTPVGYVVPNSERDNGCNLAVFATPREM